MSDEQPAQPFSDGALHRAERLTAGALGRIGVMAATDSDIDFSAIDEHSYIKFIDELASGIVESDYDLVHFEAFRKILRGVVRISDLNRFLATVLVGRRL
jgi:hypothetical protein